ncbi:MAG TPA: hypothetical protein VF708_05850 [Pyrinomonadaceae bacterium]|jgi:hypothetical protein
MKAIRKMLNQSVALLIVIALLSLSMESSFAAPFSTSASAPQTIGKLSTRGNRSIVVNGNTTEPGASILDGATIETPDGTGATISLGALGEIDLAPNTVAVINYSNGQLKVTLKRGCAIVRSRQGVAGSIETPDGTNVPADQEDSNQGKRADVCFPLGATTPVVNVGAAANAGAGAGGAGAAGGAAATTGTSITGTTVAVIAGISAVITGLVIGFTTTSDNDSQSSPVSAL